MTGKTPKRPRDPNQLAKMIVDIATGEKEDVNPSKLDTGSAGGLKRAEVLTKPRRIEIAKNAAKSRWSNDKSKKADSV